MITALSLADRTGADVSLLTSNAKVLPDDLRGFFGTGTIRQSKRPRPTNVGALNDTRWDDGKLMSAAISVVGTDESDSWTQYFAITKPMVETLDYGAAVLKWTLQGSGLQLQRSVKLDADIDPPVATTTGRELLFLAQFFAEDPRAYSQTLTTTTGAALSVAAGGDTFPDIFPDTFTPSGGGIATPVNAGNRRTPPIFRVYGACTNPQLLNVDTGERIVLSNNGVTVNAGDYLEVDVAERTVTLNGTANYQNTVTSASTTWWELPSGTTNVRLLADTFNGSARVDVIHRSAYA